MKRLIPIIVALSLLISLLLSGCSKSESKTEKTTETTEIKATEIQSTPDEPATDGTLIKLSDKKITINGKDITSDSTQAVYSANDIVFYPEGKDFTFGEGTKEDEHSQSEADAHTVVHITKPGRYILSGKLSSGQIAVDLGEDAEEDPDATVTLILDGADITCTVAPAVIFYNVYECSEADEETATKDVDTTNAGANVIIADDSVNNINGSYVAKIYKSYELSEDGTEVIDSKKLHKYDGAFYSKKSLNINGEEKQNGILNIKAENEGLNSELHLTINGGIINITAGNDGINTNEDNISVTTINGGELNIICDGTTGEGDGIDSNGWLVINGGTVTAQACATSGDAGIDSDKGIYINGGKVIATGNMLDRIAGGEQTYAVFSFNGRQEGESTYTLKNFEDSIIFETSPVNAFTYLIIADEKLSEGDYTFYKDSVQLEGIKIDIILSEGANPDMPQGEMPEGMTHPEMPEGMTPPAKPEGEQPDVPQGERPEKPEGMTHPEMPEDEPPEFMGGERPEMSEGMTPPEMHGGNMMQNGEASSVFAITKGGNQFVNIRTIS